MTVTRKKFFLQLLAGSVLPWCIPMLAKLPGASRLKRFLRPPGALPEKDFLSSCIGCGQCSSVCPNHCIELHGLEDGVEGLATPYIIARSRGCILCMACTQVCPTDALTKLEPTLEGKLAVDMGTAYVAEDICYSYAGRTCGVCYHSCPLPGKAMKLGLYETPIIDPEYCVGCGLCEQACVHMPQAIRVVPRSEEVRTNEGVAS